jgi:uncharacterized RDD family membrane protein YckC
MTDEYRSQWPDASSATTQSYYAQQPPSLGYSPRSGYPQPGNLTAPRQADYASWTKRVRARLLDQFPIYLGLVIFCAGYVVLIIQLASSSEPHPHVAAPAVVMIIGMGVMLAGLGWTAYNRWMIAGRTGQSLGKRSTKIILLGEETYAPIGARNAFIRDLVHILDALTVVGYLWPRWDEKKQTLADQIMRTIVINQSADHLPS